MPQLQRPLREKLGEEIGYFARAFQGRLIRSLSEATRKDDPDSLILDFLRVDGASVGACGTMAKCQLNAPVACLTCHFFEPFWQAPWERLLAWLEDDAGREPDPKIQQINVNAISSVKEIMARRDAEMDAGAL